MKNPMMMSRNSGAMALKDTIRFCKRISTFGASAHTSLSVYHKC